MIKNDSSLNEIIKKVSGKELIELGIKEKKNQIGISKLNRDTFLYKVTGDSMIEAGIDHEDLVLIQSKKEFISGDIVLAEVDGKTTIKRFISEDKPPYLYLKPENSSHKIIYFKENIEMKGKVIAVIKKDK